MAKRTRKRQREPLTVGDVFIVPLADGRFGAVRVIRPRSTNDPFADDPDLRVVAATHYIAAAKPTIDDPALRQLLTLTHHFHTGRKQDLCALWLFGPPPAEFELLGNIPPARAEMKIYCNSFSAWSYFPRQVLMQWRWDHDREAVLAEEAQEARAEEQRQAERDRQKRGELAKMTYRSFRDRKLFKDWGPPTPRKMIQASRELMKETATKLRRVQSTR